MQFKIPLQNKTNKKKDSFARNLFLGYSALKCIVKIQGFRDTKNNSLYLYGLNII